MNYNMYICQECGNVKAFKSNADILQGKYCNGSRFTKPGDDNEHESNFIKSDAEVKIKG